MVSAGDFRNGVTFEMDGGVYQIIEFQHVKPGKGAAFVRTKIRNVITGAVVEKTFSPTDKYPTAFVERKDMEYLYNDGSLYYFMDLETFENIPINADILPDSFKFVKENEQVENPLLQRECFWRGAPVFCGARDHPHRARLQGRYRPGRHQARRAGNRRRGQGSPLHQRGGENPNRHPHRRIYGARLTGGASRNEGPWGYVPAGMTGKEKKA